MWVLYILQRIAMCRGGSFGGLSPAPYFNEWSTWMSFRSFVSFSCLLLAAFLIIPSLSWAGSRGITRDFNLTYETRNTDTADIDRMMFSTQWSWELTRRSRLKVEVPFGTSSVKDKGTGASSNISGLKDIMLDYRLDTRKPEGDRPGLFYRAKMNLPTGQATLNAEEQNVINAINDTSEGFYNPEYGRGLALSLGAGLSMKQGGNGTLEISAGFNFRGEFDPSDGISRDDADTFYLGIKSLRQVNPRKRVSWGFNALVFGNGEVTDKATGISASVNREPDFILSYAMYQEVNPGLKRDIVFVYTLRGEQDFVDAGGANVTPNTDLGDRMNLEFRLHKKLTPVSWLDYGISYMKTFDSSVAGGPDLDTDRDDARLVVGTTRDMNSGFKLNGNLQFGLTDEARDLVTTVGGKWDF